MKTLLKGFWVAYRSTEIPPSPSDDINKFLQLKSLLCFAFHFFSINFILLPIFHNENLGIKSGDHICPSNGGAIKKKNKGSFLQQDAPGQGLIGLALVIILGPVTMAREWRWYIHHRLRLKNVTIHVSREKMMY